MIFIIYSVASHIPLLLGDPGEEVWPKALKL